MYYLVITELQKEARTNKHKHHHSVEETYLTDCYTGLHLTSSWFFRCRKTSSYLYLRFPPPLLSTVYRAGMFKSIGFWIWGEFMENKTLKASGWSPLHTQVAIIISCVCMYAYLKIQRHKHEKIDRKFIEVNIFPVLRFNLWWVRRICFNLDLAGPRGTPGGSMAPILGNNALSVFEKEREREITQWKN